MENKWLMFKNYMHSELGITKEDIRQWIEDAVQEQAERLVKNEFKSFDVHRVVQRIISDENYYGSKHLKQEISQELTRQILQKMKFE